MCRQLKKKRIADSLAVAKGVRVLGLCIVWESGSELRETQDPVKFSQVH